MCAERWKAQLRYSWREMMKLRNFKPDRLFGGKSNMASSLPSSHCFKMYCLEWEGAKA